MARRIELGDDALVVRYSGLSALAVLLTELRIPLRSVRSVTVGLDELPGALAPRLGVNVGPFGDTRRGTFWTRGRRLFLDLNERHQAIVLELEGERFARVALGVDHPEELAGRIRTRVETPTPPAL